MKNKNMNSVISRASTTLTTAIWETRLALASRTEGTDWTRYGSDYSHRAYMRGLAYQLATVEKYIASVAVLSNGQIMPIIRAELLSMRRWARHLGRESQVPYYIDELAARRREIARQGGDR